MKGPVAVAQRIPTAYQDAAVNDVVARIVAGVHISAEQQVKVREAIAAIRAKSAGGVSSTALTRQEKYTAAAENQAARLAAQGHAPAQAAINPRDAVPTQVAAQKTEKAAADNSPGPQPNHRPGNGVFVSPTPR